MEFGEFVPIPVQAEILSTPSGIRIDAPTAREILWYMSCNPNSDLRKVLEGKKSFSEVLMP